MRTDERSITVEIMKVKRFGHLFAGIGGSVPGFVFLGRTCGAPDWY